MKTTIRILLAAMLLLAFSFQSHAQGTLIDQESDATPINPLGNGNVDGLYLSDEQQGQDFTQSFIPSQSAIDFVTLEFEHGTGAASVHVNIYTSSPFAQQRNLIGTSETITLPSGFENNGLYDSGVATFDFSTPIALTAGDTYYIEALCSSGGAQWAIVTLSYGTYPNGQLFNDGSAFNPVTDFWFQEGVDAVPEPTTLALIALGGVLLFGRSALSSKCFFNAGCALWIRRFQSFKQSVRTGFEKLRQAGKCCQRNRKLAMFNVPDSFPMHAHQFRQTFLRHIGLMPCVADMLAKQPQNLLVCHTA